MSGVGCDFFLFPEFGAPDNRVVVRAAEFAAVFSAMVIAEFAFAFPQAFYEVLEVLFDEGAVGW